MIKIGNTYIPEQPITGELKAISLNEDKSLTLVINFQLRSGMLLTTECRVNQADPKKETELFHFFDLHDPINIGELNVGEIQIPKTATA